MKIAFYEIEDWEAQYLRQRLKDFDLCFYPQRFGDDQLPDADADILSTFTGSPVTPKVLAHTKKLKFVTTRTTGFDHIDLKACREKGVAVSNVPTYGENTVAEFAFALLLAVSRKICPAAKRVREDALFSSDGLQGFDLKGKVLGVVGTGHIGTCVVKIARGFDMHVVAFDPHPNEDLAKEFGFEYVSLEDLLKQSDVVTLHVPYLPATHHLINSDNIKLLKKGSVLINTARGGLVDSLALAQALKEGRVAGAGLDVLEEEGFIKEELEILCNGHPNEQQMKTALIDHELMHMSNVIITPHNAFNSKEAIQRILDTTIANIRGFAGGNLINLVKTDKQV